MYVRGLDECKFYNLFNYFVYYIYSHALFALNMFKTKNKSYISYEHLNQNII